MARCLLPLEFDLLPPRFADGSATIRREKVMRAVLFRQMKSGATAPPPPRFAELRERRGRRIEVRHPTTGELAHRLLNSEPVGQLMERVLGRDAVCVAAGDNVAPSPAAWEEWEWVEGRESGSEEEEQEEAIAEVSLHFDWWADPLPPSALTWPPEALTCIVPLVALGPHNGATEFPRDDGATEVVLHPRAGTLLVLQTTAVRAPLLRSSCR